MKHALFVLLAVGLLAGIAGCRSAPVGGHRCGLFGACKDTPETCRSVDGCNDCAAAGPECRRGCQGGGAVDPVPPSGVVTYPYYTTRGPRDFLANQPRSIGP